MSAKKLLYVAGKYRDERGAFYVEQNIYKSKLIAVDLWHMGYYAVWPHGNTLYFEGAVDVQDILAGDIAILRRCDGLVMVPGWESSVGARGEWRAAYEARLPIFYWDLVRDREGLRQWAADDFNIEKHIKLQRSHESPDMLDHMPTIIVERRNVSQATAAGTLGTSQARLGGQSLGSDRSQGSEAPKSPGD